MQRILIIGICGSGKSTFAKKLAKQTALPLVHMDKLFWGEKNHPVPQETFQESLQQALSEETWIIEGNFVGSLTQRMERADTIIWLDCPTLIAIKSIINRAFFQKEKRTEMPSDFSEKANKDFLHFILYTFHFKKKFHQQMKEILAKKTDEQAILYFKNRKELYKWFEKEFEHGNLSFRKI